jgi:hypothetical protein
MAEEQVSYQRVSAVLALFITGFLFVVVGHVMHDWMVWATGALVIRFGIWLGED